MKTIALAALMLAAAWPSAAQIVSDESTRRAAQIKHDEAVAKKRNELEKELARKIAIEVYPNTPASANALYLKAPCYKSTNEKGEAALEYLKQETLVEGLKEDLEYAKQKARVDQMMSGGPGEAEDPDVAKAKAELEKAYVKLDALGEIADMYGAREYYDIGMHRFLVKDGRDLAETRCK